MSQEIRITASIQVKKGSLFYQSQPSAFTADMAGLNGPTPGAVTVSVNGAAVNFSQLTKLGGVCRLMNLDPTNYVEYGVKEPSSGKFFPLGEILPGESYPLRLARRLAEEETGTGTFVPTTTNFFMKAFGGPCVVLVEAFDP